MNDEPFTDITDEEDLDALAVQYMTLKDSERVLKRNIAIIKKKIEGFLDDNKMYNAETDTHIITESLAPCVLAARIESEEAFSSHAPVIIDYDIEL